MTGRNMQRTRTTVLIVATCVLCLVRVTICDVDAEKSKAPPTDEVKKPEQHVQSPKIDHATKNKTTVVETTKPKAGIEDVTSKSKKPVVEKKPADPANVSTTSEQPVGVHSTSLNSGALVRGFYVFVGLSMIALAYMVFRSFRVNKSRTQMVRKYGVLAHKQDIEMRPLPLDEDDEDDTTVFDVTGLGSPRPQS